MLRLDFWPENRASRLARTWAPLTIFFTNFPKKIFFGKFLPCLPIWAEIHHLVNPMGGTRNSAIRQPNPNIESKNFRQFGNYFGTLHSQKVIYMHKIRRG